MTSKEYAKLCAKNMGFILFDADYRSIREKDSHYIKVGLDKVLMIGDLK